MKDSEPPPTTSHYSENPCSGTTRRGNPVQPHPEPVSERPPTIVPGFTSNPYRILGVPRVFTGIFNRRDHQGLTQGTPEP